MAIKIDTSRVDTAATKIASHNSKIRDDFSSVIDAVNVLNRNWDGGASNNAIRAFNHIKETYCNHRFSVINDLVTLLRVQVSSDYQKTEANIKKNAEAFK